ncbi:FABP family protein [Mycolicibacterium confluentis]|uniref:Peroxynitrite isomerase n=1 Tax=Mycolicibacterium confluentis TaxID=28047 RepID=A0A7I7XR02_9MYCO|nr:FABP family protein [Mycolicibacterium confluentis]MCV7322550.1 FABP family protein [Mycolicibacterium confluentis]BBZ31707.1 UPF0678 fatty acid-binding protein-like protein [Mycolicibacterium confluentis]
MPGSDAVPGATPDSGDRADSEDRATPDSGVRATPGSGDRAVAAAAERAKATSARNIPVFDDLPAPADTANLREGADLHDALLALLPLIGVWRGEGEGRGPHGDYRFGQQIVVSHDGADYLNWEARSWHLDDEGGYREHALRETGYWRFVADSNDPSESQAIELLLAHSTGYIELFYGRPLNQSSWELVTDALARSKSGVLVGGAKRLYGIIDGGDLAYVEERVDADGGLVPHLSARLSRYVG